MKKTQPLDKTERRVYRIAIPKGRPLVYRKLILAMAEWRGISARGVEHFDSGTGRVSISDFEIVEAADECRIEVKMLDRKSGDEVWKVAQFDDAGDYVLTTRRPSELEFLFEEAPADPTNGAATEVVSAPRPTPVDAIAPRQGNQSRRREVQQAAATGVASPSLWQQNA